MILSEVRQKKIEAKRLRKTMQSLRELRSLRARSLESRCGLFSREEDTNNFNHTMGIPSLLYFFSFPSCIFLITSFRNIEQLDRVIQRQFETYGKEEQKLKSMVKNNHEIKKMEDAIQ